jgi:PBSX family phage terminase large subunit
MHVKLLKKQEEIFRPTPNVDYDIALYQGGVGSGKTFCGVLTGLSVLMENPATTWIVASDTWTRLEKSTFKTYVDVLSESQIPFTVNRSGHFITIGGAFNNAVVLFAGLDDPQKLRSVKGVGAHIEEASLISSTAYHELVDRLREKIKPNTARRIVLTTNPEMTKGWLFHEFVTNAGVRSHKVSVGDQEKHVTLCKRRVIAKTSENEHLSFEYVASLAENYDPALYRIMVLGEDADYTKGLVCYNFDEDIDVKPLKYDHNAILYLTCDFNIDPMSWAIAQLRYDDNGQLHFEFIDELVLENTTTVEAAEEFARRYSGQANKIILTGDASGKNRSTQAQTALDTNYTVIQNVLNQGGFRGVSLNIPSGNPAVEARTAAWTRATCDSNGTRRIHIDPKCKKLIYNCNELRYVEGTSMIWEPTIQQISKDPSIKFVKHVWDAASYLVYLKDPIKRSFAQSESIYHEEVYRPW